MRTIKFRVLDDSGKWQYSNLDTINFWTFVGSGAYREETLGQFTGLLDKESKEIWEGDVIKFKETKDYDPEVFEERTMQVQFLGGAFSPAFFMDYALHDEDDKPMRIWDIEVLGNIWESPKLLDKK